MILRFALLVTALLAAPVFCQADDPKSYPMETLGPVAVPWEMGGAKFTLHTREQDSAPFPAHRIAGNVYYVGQADYAAYLITTPAGHILIDTTFEGEVPLVRKSIEGLGFRLQDVKMVLITHAHRDHAGGAFQVKELTGAQLLVMDADVEAVERGGPDMPAVKVSRVLRDKDAITLGGVTIVARRTPGHTPGNTTYTWKVNDGGKMLDVVVSGSLSSSARVLAAPPPPTLLEDYLHTFRVLRSLPCDVFLSSHGKFFDLREKYDLLQKGGVNPYIDPKGYRAHIKLMEQPLFYKLDFASRQTTR